MCHGRGGGRGRRIGDQYTSMTRMRAAHAHVGDASRMRAARGCRTGQQRAVCLVHGGWRVPAWVATRQVAARNGVAVSGRRGRGSVRSGVPPPRWPPGRARADPRSMPVRRARKGGQCSCQLVGPIDLAARIARPLEIQRGRPMNEEQKDKWRAARPMGVVQGTNDSHPIMTMEGATIGMSSSQI